MAGAAETAGIAAGESEAAGEPAAEPPTIEELQRALAGFAAAGERLRAAETQLALGDRFTELEDHSRAAELYARALSSFRALGDDRQVAAALHRLGVALTVQGESTRARAVLEEALELRRRLGQTALEPETRNQLCLVLQRSGRFHDAGECYDQALAGARAIGDRELEATLLNNLGGVAQNLGEPATALARYREAIALQRELGDELGEAVSLNNLGFYHHGLGEAEEALLHYAPALAIFERLDERLWTARTLNNIGFAHLALGEPERARAVLRRALPLRRAVGDRSGEAVTLRNLGRAARAMDRPVEAIAFFRRALEASAELGDRRGEATARQLLGEVESSLGRWASARSHLETALDSWRRMGARREQAEALTLLSDVHRSLGDAAGSTRLAEQALILHRAVRSPVGEITALVALARAHRTTERFGAARQTLERAVEIFEALHRELGDPRQRASFLASRREVYELLVDALAELHRRDPGAGHDLAALEASERARSRSLLALLEADRGGVRDSASPELEERLRAAERRFAAKKERQLRVLGREHDESAARAVEAEVYAALGELENLRAERRRADPRYAALERAETLDAAGIRALLDAETMLLEFLLGEERSHLWAVTSSTVTLLELPPRRTIEELARRAYRRLSEPAQRPAATRELLDELGEMLLGPLAEHLARQRLAIVPDGALHLVPFAALTLPARSAERPAGRPVIDRHEVVYLSSASVLALQRREHATRGSTSASPRRAPEVAIFADPIFDRRDPRLARLEGGAPAEALGDRDAVRSWSAELERLPSTRKEAEAIAAQVPGERLLIALGAAARRDRVLAGELASYDVLHFATHGFVHPRAPELSGLVLSRVDAEGRGIEGFLGLYDVVDLELSARLVVLSGCGTALGRPIRGEGFVGLSRGFLYAGAERVMASLWQVRDRATAELMGQFYRALLGEEMPPAAALRQAQLALRAERRWRDPFFWAAFALEGDWR